MAALFNFQMSNKYYHARPQEKIDKNEKNKKNLNLL